MMMKMTFPANSIRTLLIPSSSSSCSYFSIYQFRNYHTTRRLYSSRRNVLEILEERGLLDSLTSDALRRRDPNLPLRAYCGFDPTAESLHLGNLLGIIVLSWFLRCCHRAVALVGGATGRVGNPSSKSLERPDLNPLSLERNVSAISSTVRAILSSSPSVSIMYNYDWWKDVKLLDFLRDVGKFARVDTMMAKESVRKRLDSDQGMSYTEFTYQLLQGYDFLHLYRDKGINVQIGGSDQWGNITVGTDLICRILQINDEENGAYEITFPLLLKSDGTKFGKSEDGAIWLSLPSFRPYEITFPLLLKSDGTKFGKFEDGAIWLSALLSPYQFYQYFSISDADIVRFLRMLTFLPTEEIQNVLTTIEYEIRTIIRCLETQQQKTV